MFRAALPLLLLAACAVREVAEDRAVLRVAGSPVTVVAPAGFCVDPQSVDVTRAGGRLLFGDCAVLNGVAAEGAPVAAVISASISEEGVPGSLADLRAFLVEGPGVVTLGRSGLPDQVRVRASAVRDGVLYIKIEDRGPSPIPGAAPVFWRGFFEAGERLVIGTVNGFGSGLSDGASQRILKSLADGTRAANPVAVAAEDAEPAS
ncbi:MAG: hypothetical protein AAFY59_12315 [Pseudomonadota bacterium]